MEYCEAHIEMVKNIAEIKVKLDQIDEKIEASMEPMRQHIKQGEQWRLAVIGIIFAGIIQVITFAYFWGSLYTQVRINTERWDRLLEKNPVVVSTNQGGSK